VVEAVRVEILGNEYVLRSEAGAERIRRVAEVLNAKLNEVLSTTNTSSTLATAVLAALNITNELLQLQDRQDNLLQEIEAKTERLLFMIEEQKA
jgi:cell division protein ZapA